MLRNTSLHKKCVTRTVIHWSTIK